MRYVPVSEFRYHPVSGTLFLKRVFSFFFLPIFFFSLAIPYMRVIQNNRVTTTDYILSIVFVRDTKKKLPNQWS